MSGLLSIARFTFHEGRLEDYKRLTQKCIDIVRSQDTGTIRYDVFISDDESEAIVIEEYTDSQALADHLAHIGDELMTEISGTGTLWGEVLGHVTPEFRAQIEGAPVRIFTPLMSMQSGS